MNKNIIQFIVDENGQYISIPVGRVKAKSNLTTRIQLVTPITASTAVNYLIYDSKNINKKQYLIPTGELGSAVVDPNNPNYQLVAGWKVYEADIYAPILSVISKYRTGKVGMSFEFVEQVPNALCTNFVDCFGFTKDLPETAEVGEYYICEDYNFWLNDKLYNKGDILVWYNEQWNDGGILPKALTETENISVDPAISYPTEEVDETAFGNAIGELAEDVAELESKTNALETNLNAKQDKVDLGLNTTVKTVVGGINEVKTQEEAHYNALNINKLDKNFNLLVERTFAQLTDFVAVRSGNDTLKMSLETLRTYLTQGLVGLSFVLVDELPPTGVAGVIYLVPSVESIVRVDTFEELPETGLENTIYITEDNNNRYQWNIDAEEYESYSHGYEEYIWLEELNKYELIGNTQVDLTGYATELWVTENFVAKTQLSGGTTGQILAKKSDANLDVEWTDIEIPTANLNGVDMLLDPAKTYLVIKTPADNDIFTLLTGTSGSPNYTIDWGDGTSDNIIGTANPEHTYEKAGMYLITISDTISGTFTNGIVVGSTSNPNKKKIIEVYGGSNHPTNIGSNAFYDCTNLTTVNFPKVTSIIGSNVFYGCTNLTTVNFPKVTSIINSNVFYGCTNLTTVNFPKVTSIGPSAFYGCISLTTVNFPEVTSIGSNAFRNCTNLTTVNFPEVTSIGPSAFYNCTSLKELTIGNVITVTSGNRLASVVLDKLTISGNITDADINRIKQFYADNGGTFSNSYELKHGLQVSKIPTLDNDVVRKVDLDDLTPDADKVAYNNATSGLIADNVQDALDELDNKTVEAVQVSYDNAMSGLSATNVQSAINELQSEKIDKADIVTTISGTPSDTKVASESAVKNIADTKVNTSAVTTTAPNIASTDDTVPTSQAVYEALTSASGLTIGTLASPSPTQSLSTQEAVNGLLTSSISLTTTDTTIFTSATSLVGKKFSFLIVTALAGGIGSRKYSSGQFMILNDNPGTTYSVPVIVLLSAGTPTYLDIKFNITDSTATELQASVSTDLVNGTTLRDLRFLI